jgi:biotin transport system substrate-specific component
MSTVRTAQQLSMTPTAVVRRSLAILAGALLVAVGAQMAVPISGTPVPLTLQVPAVLVVGALLGPRLGALSLAVYVALGVAGFPVFAPLGAPGIARLLGPSGGYLLAFPLAAAVTGRVSGTGREIGRLSAGLLLGLLVIHAAGVAQLVILGGNVVTAVSLGSIPFLAGDALKLIIAGLVAWRLAPKTRALL